MPPCDCCNNSCIMVNDTFARADNADISAGSPTTYTVVAGSAAIVSDALSLTADNTLVRCDEADATDGDVKVQVEVAGADGDEVIVALKYKDADNYYYAKWTTGTGGSLKLYSRISGTDSELNTLPIDTIGDGRWYPMSVCFGAGKFLAWIFNCFVEFYLDTAAVTGQQYSALACGTASAAAFRNFYYSHGATTSKCPACSQTVWRCGGYFADTADKNAPYTIPLAIRPKRASVTVDDFGPFPPVNAGLTGCGTLAAGTYNLSRGWLAMLGIFALGDYWARELLGHFYSGPLITEYVGYKDPGACYLATELGSLDCSTAGTPPGETDQTKGFQLAALLGYSDAPSTPKQWGWFVLVGTFKAGSTRIGSAEIHIYFAALPDQPPPADPNVPMETRGGPFTADWIGYEYAFQDGGIGSTTRPSYAPATISLTVDDDAEDDTTCVPPTPPPLPPPPPCEGNQKCFLECVDGTVVLVGDACPDGCTCEDANHNYHTGSPCSGDLCLASDCIVACEPDDPDTFITCHWVSITNGLDFSDPCTTGTCGPCYCLEDVIDYLGRRPTVGNDCSCVTDFPGFYSGQCGEQGNGKLLSSCQQL